MDKTTGYVLRERVRYLDRKGGNPHIVREVYIACPDCRKERWTAKQYLLKHNPS